MLQFCMIVFNKILLKENIFVQYIREICIYIYCEIRRCNFVSTEVTFTTASYGVSNVIHFKFDIEFCTDPILILKSRYNNVFET